MINNELLVLIEGGDGVMYDTADYLLKVANFTRKIDFTGKIYACQPEVTLSALPYGIALNANVQFRIFQTSIWQGNVIEISRDDDHNYVLKCGGASSRINENFTNSTYYQGADPREYAKQILTGLDGTATSYTPPNYPVYSDDKGWSAVRISNPSNTLGNLGVAPSQNAVVRGYEINPGQYWPNFVDGHATLEWSTSIAAQLLDINWAAVDGETMDASHGAREPLCWHHKRTYNSAPAVPYLQAFIAVAYDTACSQANYLCVGKIGALGLWFNVIEESNNTQLFYLRPYDDIRDGQEQEVNIWKWEPRKVIGIKHKKYTVKAKQPAQVKTPWSVEAVNNYFPAYAGQVSGLSINNSFQGKELIRGPLYSIFDTDNNQTNLANYVFIGQPVVTIPDVSSQLKTLADQEYDPLVPYIVFMQNLGPKTISVKPFEYHNQSGELAFLSQCQLVDNTINGLKFIDYCPYSANNCHPLTIDTSYVSAVSFESEQELPQTFNFSFESSAGKEYSRSYTQSAGKDTMSISLCQGYLWHTAQKSGANSYLLASNLWEGTPGLLRDRFSQSGGSDKPFGLLKDDGTLLDLSGIANNSSALSGYSPNPDGQVMTADKAAYEPFFADTAKVIVNNGDPRGNDPALDISPVLQALNAVKEVYGGDGKRQFYRLTMADKVFNTLQVGDIVRYNLPLGTENAQENAAIVCEVTIDMNQTSIVLCPLNYAREARYTKRSTL